ncbi:hypothetical protein LSTR_LSTR012196 [Laodelphax striatellus]|uniref:SAM domain-containing protein n=1 Tax=Laodelphax striatellus TaxID=195883 RepID=A0A482WY18_LAOST|nr:hypothetical protein LSTR_LSTR012196 [Laodelphax striatellus]
MSSTQALINMVRTASAQSANQLETYLKGIKRGAENPLDLSATKKVRKSGAGLSLSESLYGDALLGLPMLSALNRASKDLLPTTHRLQTKSPKPSKPHTKNNHNSVGTTLANNGASNSSSIANNLATNSPVTISPVTTSPVTNRPQCVSLCSDKPCGGMTNSGVSGRINAESAESGSPAEIASWSVDDVANFVGTIDICAEYSGNFRDQRIDGSALPLLTETHLTSALQMKLGPALKLRSVLSRRLGHCAVCMHCVHCHGSQASLGGPQALLGTTGPTGTQALLGTTGPMGTQALLGTTGPTGTQALLTTSSPQALIAGASQGGSQAFSASRGQSPQALLGTTGPQASQPPPSTPSPKPLTRPSSTGN